MNELPDDIFERLEQAIGQWNSQIAEAHDFLTQQISRAKDQAHTPDTGRPLEAEIRRDLEEIKQVLLVYHEAAKAQAAQIHHLTDSVRELYARVNLLGQRSGRAEGAVVENAPTQLEPSPALDRMYAFEADGTRRRLGEILVGAHLISERQLATALEHQNENPQKRLGAVLVDFGFATPRDIAEAIGAQLHVPYIDLRITSIAENAAELLNERLARRHECIPLAIDGDELEVAMANPLDLIAIEDIERATGLHVLPRVAATDVLYDLIDKHYPVA